MDNYLLNIDWQMIGQIILLATSAGGVYLFRRPSQDSQKVLKIGAGIFAVTAALNISGLSQISDYFGVLSATIISFSLLRLFWSETKNGT